MKDQRDTVDNNIRTIMKGLSYLFIKVHLLLIRTIVNLRNFKLTMRSGVITKQEVFKAK